MRRDPFDLERVASRWPDAVRGGTLRWAAVTDSTNDDAAALLADGATAPVLVCAEEQRKGRGRRGNTWVSPGHRALQVSWGRRSRLPGHELPRLALAAGVAIARAIEGCTSLKPGIKWPNDLYLGERKVGGVLVESRPDGDGFAVVTGIGLNVSADASWLAERGLTNATSLLVEGAEVDREDLLAALVPELVRADEDAEAGRWDAISQALTTRCWLRGRHVTIETGRERYEGRVVAVDLRSLVLETPEGEVSIPAEHAHVV